MRVFHAYSRVPEGEGSGGGPCSDLIWDDCLLGLTGE